MSRWAWLAILAIVAVGCGQRAPARAPRSPATASPSTTAPTPVRLADDLPRLAGRAKELYLAWQSALSNGDLDCTTASVRTNHVADVFADVAEANREVVRAGHERITKLRAELDTYDAEIGPAAKAIVESPIMSRCVDDPAFARAIDRLAGEG
jgi:hypothetical protein